MPTRVDIPTIGLVDFPDSMTESEIEVASQELYDGANPPKPGIVDRIKQAVGPGLQAYGEALAADPAANEIAGQAIRDSVGAVVDAARSGLESASRGARMMGVADVGGAVAHPMTPPVPVPRIQPDPKRSQVGQVAAGVANVGAGVLEGVTTPVGMATLAMGALPTALQRVVAGAFAADMATKLPEMAGQVGEASVTGDLQQQVEAVGNLAATAGMTGLAGRHALTPARVAAARGVAAQLDRAPVAEQTASAAAPIPRVLDITEIPVPGTKGSMGEPWEYQPLRVAQPDIPPARRGVEPIEPVQETPLAPADPIEARQAIERGDVPAPDFLTSETAGDTGQLGSPRQPDLGLPAGTTPVTGNVMPVSVNRVVPGKVAMPEIFTQLNRVMETAGTMTPLRTGRMGPMRRWALGFFKHPPEVIRLRSAMDLPTAAHEVAHALANQWWRRTAPAPAGSAASRTAPSRWFRANVPREVSIELQDLGRNLYGSRRPAAGYLEEGWAEFMRLHLTTDAATTRAPHTARWFANRLTRDQPEVARELARARDMIDVWRGQGALGRQAAMMMESPGAFRKSLQQIRASLSVQAQIEEFTPLEAASKFWQRRTGQPLRPGQDPYLVATRLRGIAPTVMQRFLHRGTLDIDGNPTGGRPLADVLAPVLRDVPGWEKGLHSVLPSLAPRVKQRLQNFAAYLHARRTLERAGKNQETGLSVDDAQSIIAQVETPEFQSAASGYYQWFDAVLEYFAQSSPGNRALAEAVRQGSKDYVPLPRVLDPATTRAREASKQGGGLYRMRGSGRPIQDIFESTFRVANGMIERAHRALVADTVLRLSELPGMAHLVEEVPIQQVRQQVPMARIRAELQTLGVNTRMVPDDALIEYVMEADRPGGVDAVYPRRDGQGQMHWYVLDPRVAEILSGVDSPRVAAGYLAKATAWTTRTFKLGTTGLRPAFQMVTNPLRDTQTYMMQMNTANPARGFGALMSSIVDMVRGGFGGGSEYWQALHDLGVPMSNSVAHDIATTRSAKRGLFHGRVIQAVTEPVNTFRELIGGFESVPRVAQLRLVANEVGWQPGQPLTRDQAVAMTVAAKRVTTDFTAGGKSSRQVNLYVPFFNTAIQGARTTGRMLRATVDQQYAQRNLIDQSQAQARIALGGLTMTAMALANWYRNKDSEWYRGLPWRERYLYTNIDTGDGTVARVPRPVEWGNLFMGLPEAIADTWYREDPEAAKAAVEHFLATTGPIDMSSLGGAVESVLPVPLKAAIEQAANRDFFWDRPIVPRGQLDLPPGEQRSERSSWVAAALGNAFPETVSPRRVDAAIRQFGGGAAADVIDAIGLKDKIHNRDWEYSDMPVAGAAFRRGGQFTAANRFLEQFSDTYHTLATRARSKDRPMTVREQVVWEAFKPAKEDIDFVRDVAVRTKELPRRQRLYETAARRAEQLMKVAKKNGIGE